MQQRSRFAGIVVCLVVALVVVPFASAQDDLSAWAGNYWVNGVDAAGAPYETGLEIVDMGGFAQLTWNYLGAERVEIGVGLPLNETQMVVAYDVTCIIQVFNIADDGTLSSAFAESFSGVGTETSMPAEARDSLGGTYNVVGAAPDTTPYSGTLEITPADGERYALTWILEMDSGTFSGIGIMSGDALIAASDQFPETPCGIGVLTRGEDGTITGSWTVESETAIYTDTATPIVLADSYTFEGINTDNSTYSGSMTLIPAGTSRYLVEYMAGETEPSSGLAILRGNIFQLVMGGEQCAAANHALAVNGILWTRTATMRNETVGVAVEVPSGETDGFIGTFSMTGTAATGAAAQGTLIFEAGENDLVLGSGEATRSTGETVDLTAIYANAGGVLVGTYAPGGDVTPCVVGVGMIAADGSIMMPFFAYGGTDVTRMDVAIPAME